ncbi:MarR family transcriptional regulator [Kitasatospora sp. SUK 42]|uniref:MarR family winged helix-turn-helix transcriptional regulator n=1 Tax=Kitasatospora sp. SUK 42 TaxID=1588882 RepID=UPI0027E3A6CD|nr:MarR family transcriptional regulator [Kitasatospora sp. SUK 42]
MTDHHQGDGLDIETLTTTIEFFNRFYIRLPVAQKLPFTTLSVLDTLAFGGPVRLTELARREQLSQPGVTQLVNRLEQDGLVERRPDPDDGRAVLVHVTDAGRRVGEDRRAERGTHLRPLIEELTSDQRRAIAQALPAMTRLVELGQQQRGTVRT